MDVSSSVEHGSIGLEVQKKAQDVKAQQISKVIEGAEQVAQDTASQATVAQKTGLGNSLNIAG